MLFFNIELLLEILLLTFSRSVKLIDSRNLQPVENAWAGGSFFIEITHFFCKEGLANVPKSEAFRALVYKNDFCEQGGDFDVADLSRWP